MSLVVRDISSRNILLRASNDGEIQEVHDKILETFWLQAWTSGLSWTDLGHVKRVSSPDDANFSDALSRGLVVRGYGLERV